ncbi:MAG: hypothetical protein SCH98_02230 [Deferrisomatales bacterium]|nr:hypothetical protein [Deferrisomatales bacterium]
MMLRCREAAQLVSKSLDAPLKILERLPLALHLGMCPRCSEYRRQLLSLRALLREELGRLLHPEAGEVLGLTPEEKDALLRTLASEGS